MWTALSEPRRFVSAAAQSVRGPARVRSRALGAGARARCSRCCWSRAAAEIVIDGAVGHSGLIPKQPAIAGWLSGIGARLGYRIFLIALLAFTGAYARCCWPAAAGRPSPSAGRSPSIGGAAADHVRRADPALHRRVQLHRLRAHGRRARLNPYLHGPIAIVARPGLQYVGQDWKHVATAYGPLYTLLSYPLAPLGVKGALWGMKLRRCSPAQARSR